MILFALLLIQIAGASAICETFNVKCPATFGTPMSNVNGRNKIELTVNGVAFYSFKMTSSKPYVDIDLSVFFGDPQIYVAKDRRPRPTDYDYSNVVSGDRDFLRIPITNYDPKIEYNVLIKAWSQLECSAIITYPGVTNTLQLGIPQQLHLAANSLSTNVFKLTTTEEVSLQITSFSNYIPSMTLQRPENNRPYNYTNGYIEFLPSSGEMQKSFTLTINAKNDSIVTVLVHQFSNEDVAVQLLDGVPQSDFLFARTEQYYIFSVGKTEKGPVTIFVDPIQGDADLYVNPPSMGFYHRTNAANDPFPIWSSARPSGRDSVVITKDDPYFVSGGGEYYITVYGYASAQYNVRASSPNVVTTLVEDVPIQDIIPAMTYKYYKFYDTKPYLDLLFDLQPTTGDADMSLSCIINNNGEDSGFPSMLYGHYNFTSQNYLEDMILVQYTDIHSCSYGSSGGGVVVLRDDDNFVPDNNNDATRHATSNVFYVAVYGYYDASYTLSVVHTGGTLTLIDGVTTTATVKHAMSNWYQFRVGYEAKELQIILSPLYGDCDLYVKMNGKAQLNDYDFVSNSIGTGMDVVVIAEDKICVNCWVTMLVYGFEDSQYSIVASATDSTIVLNNGIPQRGSVGDGEIQRYTYDATTACSVVVTVTITAGYSPTVYASITAEEPGPGTPNTAVYNSGGSVPLVSLPSVLAGQTVYIAVAGVDSNVTYTVRAHEAPTRRGQAPTLLSLVDGTPQSDAIRYDALTPWLYYQVTAPTGHETIHVRSTSMVGQVELYVIRCPYTSAYTCSLRALPNETYNSLNTVDMEMDSLDINRNDASDSLYIIGVKSLSYYAAYQISASFEHTILQLQPGISVMDHVMREEVDYFSFSFYQIDEKIQFVLTPISGDPDIYISTRTHLPGPNNYTWSSVHYGSDVVEINPVVDRYACEYCVYYVAIYGATESTYTLTANLQSTIPALVDGVPTSGAIDYMSWTYYSFQDTYGSTRDIDITLSCSTGNADLYVNLDGVKPSWVDYAYSSGFWYSADTIHISHTDTAFTPCASSGRSKRGNCLMVIGVYGWSSSTYTLTLTTTSTAKLLQLGVVATGSVAVGEEAPYRVMMSQSGTLTPFALRITVTPSSGHVSLYATCVNSDSVNATSNMWALSPADVGTSLDIPSVSMVDKGCLRSSTIYFSVIGDSAATYTVLAAMVDNSTVPLLTPNVATPGLTAYRHIDYYYLKPGSSYQDLHLTLSVYQGDVDLYVGTSWEKRPVLLNGEMSSYVAASAVVGTDELTIKHDRVQDYCANRNDNCYLVIAVLGSYSSTASSRYALLFTMADSTVTLLNGVPRTSSVASGRYQYFHYTMTQVNYDLVISVTSFSGDPDIYVGLAPNYHPVRTNFTWSQNRIGADTLTVQYRDISRKCIVNPQTGHFCEFYIGVYGWQNSSFSIEAHTNEGFAAPITLLDQQPQNGYVELGGYTYYRYYVSLQDPSEHDSTPIDIKFTLTPTDGGDLDLYAIVANNSEPGTLNYDFRSNGYSSVAENIEISYTSPKFCYNCVVYLGVYGFTAGSYSIQASSTGLTSLTPDVASGGSVRQGTFEYFTLYNANEIAELRFILTSMTGDADLYITTRLASDKKPILPTTISYKWRSFALSSDEIKIAYDDINFCVNCEYIVGVNGHQNSTYTLLVTTNSASIVKLAQNRPQALSLSMSQTQYFSSSLVSSLADVAVSMTSLNTGMADLYVRIYNATIFNSPSAGDSIRMPVPGDPRTYDYTTEDTEDDYIYLPPPHTEDSILIIAVYALTNVRINIVIRSSQSAVILQPGIPQSHFVAYGQNAIFQYYPDPEADLKISLTARSGDPDLYVSQTNSYPHCEVIGSSSWSFSCSNYTWSSRLTTFDQIVISRDFPCQSTVGTYVYPYCDPETAYNPSNHKPVYIAVYGYKDSKFTIVAAAAGGVQQLKTGEPLSATTDGGYFCSQRSSETGACIGEQRDSVSVQVAYFSFHVSPPVKNNNARQLLETTADGSHMRKLLQRQLETQLASSADVIFTVIPYCNASAVHHTVATNVTCAPGCDCSPLTMYIDSCPASKCTALDMRPSYMYNQHKAELDIASYTGSSLFLSELDNSGYFMNAYCDPTKAKEDCVYYVAVANTRTTDVPSAFTITARTPGDVSLVPCTGKTYPDGIKVSSVDVIAYAAGAAAAEQHHYYEVCSDTYYSGKSSENLVVELEQCYGSTTLYACADDNHCSNVLPSSSSYGYFSTNKVTCTHSWTAKGNNKDTCTPLTNNKPLLTLPMHYGNYYVMTQGSGKFQLTLQTTVNGTRTNPKVVYGSKMSNSVPDIVKITGNTVTLEWLPAEITFPGLTNNIATTYIKYQVYFLEPGSVTIPSDLLPHYDTLCGLSFMSEQYPEAVTIVNALSNSVNLEEKSATNQFKGLKTNTRYSAYLVASCDGGCLRQVSKLSATRFASASCATGSEDCKPQYIIYGVADFTTAATADPTETDDTSSSNSMSQTLFIVLAVIFTLLLIGFIGSVLYWHYRKNVQGIDDEASQHGAEMSSSTIFFTDNKDSGPDSGANSPKFGGGFGGESNAGSSFTKAIGSVFTSASNALGELSFTSKRASRPLSHIGELKPKESSSSSSWGSNIFGGGGAGGSIFHSGSSSRSTGYQPVSRSDQKDLNLDEDNDEVEIHL